MTLDAFNHSDALGAADVIRPCADIDTWVDALVAGRPYASVDALLAEADRAARAWSDADVDAALAHHPRIGERATGASAEATMSRSEQAGVGGDDETARALLTGNRDYETHFGRVFLIRAAGRSAEEILAELQRRLRNDPATEAAEVADQLRQIALLRLEGIMRP